MEDKREFGNSQKATTSTSSDSNNIEISTNMKSKLENASPYYLFFNKVEKPEETMQDQHTITFTDLLCPSLGELECSLQLTFLLDIKWLMEQYHARYQDEKPLTILYGDAIGDTENYMPELSTNVTCSLVNVRGYGTHHSKVGLYAYTDGSLRVVVSTANLHGKDWNHYNQGLWVSPTCKPLSEGTDGDSQTKFKESLIKYLESYDEDLGLADWIVRIKNVDFSEIQVFLVTSTPKNDPEGSGSPHVCTVSDILYKNCMLPEKTLENKGPLEWEIYVQASSMGSFGKNAGVWLRSVLLGRLATHKKAQPTGTPAATLKVIYPTKCNVENSYFGMDGGVCLTYAEENHAKQKWLKAEGYLYQWVANSTPKADVMPHIKTYCRILPRTSELAWFLLSSANISQAAWGRYYKTKNVTRALSYEVGVMFMPCSFGKRYFSISKNELSGDDKDRFPFMYNLPLTKYKSCDEPWCIKRDGD